MLVPSHRATVSMSSNCENVAAYAFRWLVVIPGVRGRTIRGISCDDHLEWSPFLLRALVCSVPTFGYLKNDRLRAISYPQCRTKRDDGARRIEGCPECDRLTGPT